MSQRSALPVLSLALAAGLALSACSTAATGPASPGASTPAGGGSQVLSIATDNPDPLKAVIEAYKKVNPDAVITTQEAPTGYEEFLRTSLAAGTAADIIRIFPGSGIPISTGKLVGAGVLADLSDASWAGELSAAQKAGFGAAGKVYAVPIGSTGLGPVYNESTLAELGVGIPTTFTQVLDLCTKATAAGKVAYSQFLKDNKVLLTYALTAPLVYGPDADFTTKQVEGQQTFAGSGWLKAFQLEKQMQDAGCFNEGATGTQYNVSFEQVAKGEAVATFAFSDVSGIESLAPEGTTVALAPLPADDSGNLYLPVADSSGYSAYAKSPNQELAKKFLEFMASADGQNAYASTGGAPALPNTTFTPVHKNQQTMIDYINDGKTAAWPDQLWFGNETRKALDEVAEGLFLGQETPEGAVAKMDGAFAEDVQGLSK